MNKIYFFILISITLCFGCENKPKQKIVNPLGIKQTVPPELFIKEKL